MSELLAPSDSFRDQALGYTHAPLLRGLEAVGLSSRPIKPAVRCSPLPPALLSSHVACRLLCLGTYSAPVPLSMAGLLDHGVEWQRWGLV